MGEPIVFISRSRVKEGGLEALEVAVRRAASSIQRDKPGTLAFLPYLDEDGAEVLIVHVFPDADAMDAHLEGVAERMADAAEVIETLGYEIHGSPSERATQMMRGFATHQGIPLTIRPRFLGGYVRMTPGGP